MQLVPGPGEPVAGPYEAVPFGRWLERLIEIAGTPTGRPRIVAIDGRGGAGKSTLTGRIAAALPGTAVVGTDDLAWNFSIFGWAEVLVEQVLEPLHRGEPVDFQPPGWASHGRTGSVVVPADSATVVSEGTGAIHDETIPWYDASVWVQSDYADASRRAIDRDVELGVNGDRAAATRFWDDWQREEIPFYLEQKPWERADLIVAGTEVMPLTGDDLGVVVPDR